jgi:hypothetical protein
MRPQCGTTVAADGADSTTAARAAGVSEPHQAVADQNKAGVGAINVSVHMQSHCSQADPLLLRAGQAGSKTKARGVCGHVLDVLVSVKVETSLHPDA